MASADSISEVDERNSQRAVSAEKGERGELKKKALSIAILSIILISAMFNLFIRPAIATPDHDIVIIKGKFDTLGYHNKIADNIIDEAFSDLSSVGYSMDIQRFDPPYSTSDVFNILMALKDPHLLAVIIVAHGDKDGLELDEDDRLDYRQIKLAAGKTLNHVFLHACNSLNPDALAAFPTNYLKAWGGFTTLLAGFYWQWLGFPSGGPHTGNYSEIDIAGMEALTAQEAIAIPTTETFDIPEAAEPAVKEASIELANGHNELIQGYEHEALNRVGNAINLLDYAYENGWTMAKDIIDQLTLILGPVGGVLIPVDKFVLLAPYIGLASTILVATAATAIYVKRVKRRKEKQ